MAGPVATASVSRERPASGARRTACSPAQAAGEFGRIFEVDAHLQPLWSGAEPRAQAGDVVLGGEKPPARTQMQPEASVDLRAQQRQHGGGLVAGSATGELEETVAFA